MPKKILNKKGKLTKDEYAVVQQHMEAGRGYILSKYKALFAAAIMAMQHHERMDGSGYAKDITRIHSYAKLIAVADVFDAN